MILLFLGSWRSTLVVIVSIPRLDAKLRLYFRGLSPRPGEISFHAARPRRRLRHARLLWPVPNLDADHDGSNRRSQAVPCQHPALRVRSFESDLRGGWKGEFFEVPSAYLSPGSQGRSIHFQDLFAHLSTLDIMGCLTASARQRPRRCHKGGSVRRPPAKCQLFGYRSTQLALPALPFHVGRLAA
jgi:hypothetical protein